jgi:hypothetical protein
MNHVNDYAVRLKPARHGGRSSSKLAGEPGERSLAADNGRMKP